MPPVSFLVKPASGLCNLSCRYCFYRSGEHARGIMDDSVARTLVRRAFAYADGSVAFAFQGGEPTLAGLPFFERFVALCREYNVRSLPVSFSMQTNGLLLDDAFCAFLAGNGFLTGLSFDGTPELNDSLRGRSADVLAAAGRLSRAGADFNVLTVVSSELASRGAEVYDSLAGAGFGFLQFIPCLPPAGGGFGEGFAPSPAAYGSFLCDIFDRWYADWKRGKYVSIRYFDNLVNIILGRGAEMCSLHGRCSNQLVVESDGSVYPCDFFVDETHRLGSISDGILRLSSAASGFTAAEPLPEHCKGCRFTRLCMGGCRRERGLSGATELCGGLRAFFAHSEKRLLAVARDISGKR